MIAFRRAVPADLSVILEIEERCFKPEDAFHRAPVRRMLNNPKGSVIAEMLLSPENPALSVGWACYFTRKNSRCIRLYGIAILPEFSGRGIAREYLSQKINNLSRDFTTILLEVRLSNTRARRLYESLGFAVVRTLVGYYPDGEDGLKMRLILSRPMNP